MAVRQAWKSYLLWCVNEHVCFRISEVESILSMYKISHVWIEKPSENPWMILSLPTESCLLKLMSRSVMVRGCYELWARSKTPEHLHEQLQRLQSEVTKPYFGPEKSFKVIVEIFNKVISMQEKVQKIESFSYLPIEGPVILKDPDVSYCYFEFFGLDPGRVPEKPLDYFFGRWIANSERHTLSKYSLKTRHFIGNTSMDPQLSMIMANLAQVENGDIVYDPFVGTGSLLIAAAHFGGYILGTDIDFLTLHGKIKPTRAFQKKRQPNEDIKGNLKQYNLSSRYVDVFVGDASRPVWRPNFKIDCIITDPPYGIREATERVGSKTKNEFPITEDLLSSHYPSKMEYGMRDMYRDLLNFAAERLKLNGRISFWVPIIRIEYDPSLLPEHPCLELVFNNEQVLTLQSSRRLITMRKIMEPKDVLDSAVIHDLQFTFRHRSLQEGSDNNDRAKEEELAKQLMKRSKRGQGVSQSNEPLHVIQSNYHEVQ